MKATLFSRVPYTGPVPASGWPVSTATFSPEAAERSMEASFQQFELADELGFDWITLAEHHYAPLSLTPNPMVMAGALSQRVRHAKMGIGATEGDYYQPRPDRQRRSLPQHRRRDRADHRLNDQHPEDDRHDAFGPSKGLDEDDRAGEADSGHEGDDLPDVNVVKPRPDDDQDADNP